jgi:stage II sporulation protein D
MALAGLTCAPAAEPVVGVTPASGLGPEIRVGLVLGDPRLAVAGDSGLEVADESGALVAAAGPGERWTVPATLGSGGSLVVRPRGSGALAINGRSYRGRLTIARSRTGFTAVNHVALEDYLASVVASEMGRRDSSEYEALRAQAILARTYAIKNLGKRATDGFDLLPTVVDQVYGGASQEYDLARQAVASTAGLIVTWNGLPIDAFFFSTCGGRTVTGTEVFAGADRPYLQSVSDLAPDGQAWCRQSPRYRWREEWSLQTLRATFRRTLPPLTGTTGEEAAQVEGVRVSGLSPSGRVQRVTVALRRGAVEVSGPAVRQALEPPGQTLLRSALFELTEVREAGRLVALVAEGRGAGHGVGFCQWGALGRARAGQDAATILGAYFPGTAISRAY